MSGTNTSASAVALDVVLCSGQSKGGGDKGMGAGMRVKVMQCGPTRQHS